MQEAVTIAILTHNRSRSLLRTVGSLQTFTVYEPCNLVILDSGSDKPNRNAIASLAQMPNITMIQFPQPLTCCEGRRHILRYIDTPYVVYLDDDITVTPRWLTRMMAWMIGEGENCGAVAAQLVRDGLTPYSGARYIQNGTIQAHPFGYTGECDICHGGATLYRMEALLKTQFRPEYSCGAEDMDMLLQLKRDYGYGVQSCDVILHHDHEPQCKYDSQRWRDVDILDSAIALWHRWGIASKAVFAACRCVQNGVGIRTDQTQAVLQIMQAWLQEGNRRASQQ